MDFKKNGISEPSTKKLTMKNPSIRSILILTIFFLIAYAFIDGIRYGNILGIVLAIGSLGAFGISILLINRLRRLKEQEEEERMEENP